MGKDEKEVVVRRDVRVDRIGFLGELYDQYGKPLEVAIKADMIVGERIAGDSFAGLLAPGGETIEVDAGRFVRLWKTGEIKTADFLSAITVIVSRAGEILGEEKFKKIVASRTPRKPSLRVTRLKGVQVELIDAVKDVSAFADPTVLVKLPQAALPKAA